MSQMPLFPRLDGLMDLAKREGVDVRPTLLRVLTDLYVQTPVHTANEDRQFVELFSRLIGSVDDATVAAVRARLSIHPATPEAVLQQFNVLPSRITATPRLYAPPLAPQLADEHQSNTHREPQPVIAAMTAATPATPSFGGVQHEATPEVPVYVPPEQVPLSPQQQRSLDAMAIAERFFTADTRARGRFLDNLEYSAFVPVPPPEKRRAQRAVEALERAALAHNATAFTMEIASVLQLPVATAQSIVKDAKGEALICALKALDMPLEMFQRVLLFLDREVGTSVPEVYRRSNLYAGLSLRTALTMLAVWRLATPSTRQSQYRPALYDDERRRGYSAPTPSQRTESRPAATPLRVSR